MLYFIPAWYQQGTWNENEQYWYSRRTHTEFDDTVKQVQLFHRSGVYPYRILLLSYTPNFRHFLHRQSVYHAPYWSVFDGIQEIRRRKVRLLSFHDMKWPEHIEFIYTPFVVVAQLHGQKYAEIRFGEDGNPIEIDLYEDGQLCRRNTYDDRGFVSRTTVYEDNKEKYQDYLTETGIRKLRVYAEDGHVQINPKAPGFLIEYQGTEECRQFSRMIYDSLEQVIEEVLHAYIEHTAQEDLFCVAMHERHTGVLEEQLKNRKYILSFFEDRFDLSKHIERKQMVESAGYVIADSMINVNKIREQVGEQLSNIIDITPFDSRVDFGITQQLTVQKILVPVDGMEQETFMEVIRNLGSYLPENDKAEIHLFTRLADYDRRDKLMRMTQEALEAAGFDPGWADSNRDAGAENTLDALDEVPVRFFVEQCVDELSVSKCMREQRLIVDMRKTPELYLRITGLSVGIPQILIQESQFVEHGKNGLILQSISRLGEALHFYLDGFHHWNEAMVQSYEMGQKYTTRVLLEKWKEVMKGVGCD